MFLRAKISKTTRKSAIKMSGVQMGYASSWSPDWSRTKKADHCRAMAYERRFAHLRVPQLPRAHPTRVALAVMLMGTGFDDALMFMAINDIPTPPVNQLYSAQKIVCEEIIKFANESCAVARAETPYGTTMSFDGAWEHRRNAARCMLTVISQQTRKVLSWMVVGRRFNNLDRRFCAVSQNMEIHALKLVIPELQALGKIVGYVHDNDAKAKKALNMAHWDLIEWLDPGHTFKSFERKLTSFNTKNKNVLVEIAPKLRVFLKFLMYMHGVTQLEKVAFWHNSANHLAGNHDGCPKPHDPRKPPKVWSGANDPAKMKLLVEFLKKTEFVVLRVVGEFSTQMNESLNRGKTKYADKDRSWKGSWPARMACAVLDRNVPHWRMELYARLKLPKLSEHSAALLKTMEEDRIARKLARIRVEENEKRRAIRRADKVAKAKVQPKGKTDYKVNPWAAKK
jgi:hypothetical protein